MNGEATVAEACSELGIGESRFHQLRSEMLQAAVDRLEPRAAGRPPRSLSPEDRRTGELEQRVQELTWELDVARLRAELFGSPAAVRPAAVKKTRPAAALPASRPVNPPVNSPSPSSLAPAQPPPIKPSTAAPSPQRPEAPPC
jgi:hypothetical protein